MKSTRLLLTALVCVGISACSGGSIAGKVTVEGGSAAGIAVFAYGPSSGATVTGSDGAFTLTGVDDGDYVVRATVRGTDEVEQSAAVNVKNGKAPGEVALAFHFSSATVTGHVVFSDGSDATGLSVVATGAETKSVVTEVGGAFTLSNLKTGAYVISVEAPSTREGRVSIGVNAAGAVDVGELRLTPVGRLTGAVTFNGAPAVGVPIMVSGTGVSAVSDATGAFELVNVPTGARTVWARTGESPFWRSGSLDVTVTRGENAALALALSDDPPKTGTVEGVVTFFGPHEPTNIVVTVDGLGVTTTVGAAGRFSLIVPVGTWDIVASASSYPKMVLGSVVVHEGQTITLTGQRLSWFRKIWAPGDGETYNVSPIAATRASVALQLLTIASGSNATGTERLALLDLQNGNLRFLATTGAYSMPTISRTGMYVAWYAPSFPSLVVYTVATGAMVSLPLADTPTSVVFSEDETTVFLPSSSGLLRVPLAATGSAREFPGDGGVVSVTQITNDHWLTTANVGGGYHLTQITTTTAQSIDVVGNNTWPLVYGWADVGSGLSLLALPWDGGAPVNGGTFPYGTTFVALGGSVASPCFRASGAPPDWFCLKMSDGTRVTLPDDTSSLATNESGSRAIFVTIPPDGGVRGFYEMPLPPAPPLTAIDTSTVGWQVSWLSAARAAALENNAADGRKLRIVNNGVAMPVDTETADGGALLAAPLLQTRQKTTGKWRSMLGDAPFRQLPLHHGWQPALLGMRSNLPTTRYAAVTFVSDTLATVMLDENAGAVSLAPWDGYCNTAFRSGTSEFALCLPFSTDTNNSAYDFARRMFIDSIDESVGTSPVPVGNEAVRSGRLAIGSDGRSILLGTYGE